ncbi:ATP-binding protein [Pedobacter agri]|uniref:ATP-binding protein n=1 Tax=Pedobacter agri TaxID=454586 RepID=UPI00292DA15F|nr:ATP-binding protein [Pedobacter agri]
MPTNHYNFTTNELNQQFPYFILMDDEGKILDHGAQFSFELDGLTLAGLALEEIFSIEDTASTKIDKITTIQIKKSKRTIVGKWSYLSIENAYFFSGQLVESTKKQLMNVGFRNSLNQTEVCQHNNQDLDEPTEKHIRTDLPSDINYTPNVFFEFELSTEGNINLHNINSKISHFFPLHNNDLQLNHFYKKLKQLALSYQSEKSECLPCFESHLLLEDGNMVYLNIGIAKCLNISTDCNLYLGYISEITQQLLSNKVQINPHMKYRDAIATMGLGFMELDNENKLLYVNKSLCDLVGYDLKFMEGRKVTEIFGDDYLSPYDLDSPSKPVSNFQLKFKDQLGKKIYVVVNQSINYGNDSEIIGYIAIIIDITRFKVKKLELINAKKEAEKSANSKELFLANMSHEIRTPMNAIMSMSNELSKTILTYEQEYCVQTIQSASKSLLVIIDDILDLSKIEAGQLNLEFIGFNLQKILHEAMQFVMHKGAKKGLTMIAEKVDRNLSKVLIGDPYRINQVILNLLSNAVKFTDKGSVKLAAKLINDENAYQEIEVIVSDTGIGMDDTFVEHLFDNFSQEFESVSRKYGGTGLGMSISKRLISQMGGYIVVKSEKGVGSTISFILKLKKGDVSDLQNEEEISVDEDLLKDRKILIIDDNEMNRLVAATILLNYGAQVMVAETGELAIEMAIEDNFDVLLMDIQMPVLNGYETTGRLRIAGYTGPIIALTASAITGEKEKCLAAGMDDYITKPIKEKAFISLLDKWIKDRPYSMIQPKIEQPLYSLEGLREISKGREDFVTKMIELFCKQMPVANNELAEALNVKDFNALSLISHKLKSTIDNLRILSIQRVIRDIETLSNSNISIEDLKFMVDTVIKTIDQVVNELEKELIKRLN